MWKRQVLESPLVTELVTLGDLTKSTTQSCPIRSSDKWNSNYTRHMISFKLAKELKEAGFRIQPSCDRVGYTITSSGDIRKDTRRYLTESWSFKGEHYFVPTLSELIEACGSPFSLRAYTQGAWNASDRPTSNGKLGKGKSPEIAVARLYLALNQSNE